MSKGQISTLLLSIGTTAILSGAAGYTVRGMDHEIVKYDSVQTINPTVDDIVGKITNNPGQYVNRMMEDSSNAGKVISRVADEDLGKFKYNNIIQKVDAVSANKLDAKIPNFYARFRGERLLDKMRGYDNAPGVSKYDVFYRPVCVSNDQTRFFNGCDHEYNPVTQQTRVCNDWQIVNDGSNKRIK
ncbi:hypothetical protein ACFL1H_06885 [Nanoarchaeota archaeon]